MRFCINIGVLGGGTPVNIGGWGTPYVNIGEWGDPTLI